MSLTQRSGFTLDTAADFIGLQIGLSEWVLITQRQVDAFSAATWDEDWMHLDPVRSRAETPFGGTIVQGFLVLSLLIHFWEQMGLSDPSLDMALNYGMDRVRFPAPVPVGSRLRLRSTMLSIEPRGEARYLLLTRNVVELEGSPKPAMVCDWRTLWFKVAA